MSAQKNYGGAYMFDGFVWHYEWGGEVLDSSPYEDPFTGEICCNAPELLVDQMFDLHDIAELIGARPRSVSNMLARGEVPKPQFRARRCALWSGIVVLHWLENRPGRGANFRKAS